MSVQIPVKWSTVFLVCVCVCLGVLATAAHAQLEERHRDEPPPPEGCLGSNDPWCNPSGGSDDTPDVRCHVCEYIPEGPEGESDYWTCAYDDSCCDTQLRECLDGLYYCYYDGYCVYT